LHTYDYNGNVLFVKPAKIEKLPPSAYNMNYSLIEEDKKKEKDGKKKDQKKEDLKQITSKLKKPPDEAREFVNKIGTYVAPPIYDLIEPQRGVVFSDGARSKRGPSVKSEGVTMIQGTLTSTDGGSIRLSKTEYNQLTKAGNLSRPTSERDLKLSPRAAAHAETTMNWTTKTNDIIKEVDIAK